ncbi:MAG: DUF4329 domain-containing protein [Pseudomonadota bacterium]
MRKYITNFSLAMLVNLLCLSAVLANDRESITDEVDLFVLDLFDRIQPRTFADGVEYCGLIGYNEDGELVATPAVKGEASFCDLDEDPENLEIIASYHTHGAASHESDTEASSITDMEGDIEDQTDGYIATPGGRVWFNDYAEETSYLLCGVGCVKADPNFVECEAFKPEDSYTLEQLIAREENDTGEC